MNVRSKKFPNTLVEMLGSGEQADDNRSSLFDPPAHAFEAQNVELDLRRGCGAQTILLRFCVLSREISKEDNISFASGGGWMAGKVSTAGVACA